MKINVNIVAITLDFHEPNYKEMHEWLQRQGAEDHPTFLYRKIFYDSHSMTAILDVRLANQFVQKFGGSL